MQLPTTQPFSFAHTLMFVRRFLPIAGDYLLGEHSLTAAIAIGDHAIPFTLRGSGDQVELDVDSAHEREVARRASDLISARDDLSEFYAIAERDPMVRPLVRALHGLHQVRFLTLPEIAVYCVMMQRAPIAVATTLRRRFLDRFGLATCVEGTTLRAFPTFEALVCIEGDEIAEAIGNRRKGPQIATVVRGVAAIGEDRLRSLPYAVARDALLEVPGIGPFSAAAILLRGLGRMDELPKQLFAELGHEVYGASFDERAIRRRYGEHIGYWSFYVKTGLARVREKSGMADALRSSPARAMRRSAA